MRRVWRILAFDGGVILLLSTTAYCAPLPIGAYVELYNRVSEFVSAGQYDQAYNIVSAFRAEHSEATSLETKWKAESAAFRALDWILSQSPQASEQVLSASQESHSRMCAIYRALEKEALQGGRDLPLSRAVEWHQNCVNYANTGQRCGMSATVAAQALQEARRVFLLREQELVCSRTTKRRNTQGHFEDVDLPVWQASHMTPPEQLQRTVIGLYSTVQTEEGRRSRMNAMDEYLEHHSDGPYAATYTSIRMKEKGTWDLDELVAAFERCGDKTHPQYRYSIQGLANRLCHAQRYSEAMAYLAQVAEDDEIPSGRVAEYHRTMAQCHYGLGNLPEALRHFRIVRAKSDAYPSVEAFIRNIEGKLAEQDREMMDALMASVEDASAPPQIRLDPAVADDGPEVAPGPAVEDSSAGLQDGGSARPTAKIVALVAVPTALAALLCVALLRRKCRKESIRQ